MTKTDISEDLSETIARVKHMDAELSFLFGEETVRLARQIDIADLNLNKEIVENIAEGVGQLKKFRGQPDVQLKLVNEMEQGSRLLLCMWIMDMDILDKIRDRPYTKDKPP